MDTNTNERHQNQVTAEIGEANARIREAKNYTGFNLVYHCKKHL